MKIKKILAIIVGILLWYTLPIIGAICGNYVGLIIFTAFPIFGGILYWVIDTLNE